MIRRNIFPFDHYVVYVMIYGDAGTILVLMSGSNQDRKGNSATLCYSTIGWWWSESFHFVFVNTNLTVHYHKKSHNRFAGMQTYANVYETGTGMVPEMVTKLRVF